MNKEPAVIGRMFDGIAPTYDRLNRLLSLYTDQHWRKITVRSLGIREGDQVLDVATGTGDLALHALDSGPCNVVAIDLSREMLSRARKKSSTRKVASRVVFINGDALSLPLKDGSIQRAMAAFGIRNVSDIGLFLDELHRVLAPGGRVAILEFSVPENAFVRRLYLTYFKTILPFIGECLSGGTRAYRYLPESVLRFFSPQELAHALCQRGFHVLSSRRLSLGIVHLYVLERNRSTVA